MRGEPSANAPLADGFSIAAIDRGGRGWKGCESTAAAEQVGEKTSSRSKMTGEALVGESLWL